MAFDLFLNCFRNGKEAFANADAARLVLLSPGIVRDSDEHGHFLTFEDGSTVALFAAHGLVDAGDFTGGLFSLHDFSPFVLDFIYRFAIAADCVMFPAMKENVAILPKPELADHLPVEILSEWPSASVSSGAELGSILSGGYEAWRSYRDRIISQCTNDGAS